MLNVFKKSGEKLATIKTDSVRVALLYLVQMGIRKYAAYFERETRQKYHIYYSPCTKRRYRVRDGEEAGFAPVEGPLYFVGFKYGETLTQRIKACIN